MEVAMSDTIAVIQLIISALGFGVLSLWVRSLRVTVDAQEKTIKAQRDYLQGIDMLVKAMKSVLESTDEPKLLERMKAYKEMVELEKEETLKQQARQFDEEKKNLSQTQKEDLKSKLDAWREAVRGLTDLTTNLMPYTPSRLRRECINSANLSADLKKVYLRLADAAPDLSPGVLGIGLEGALLEGLLTGEQKATRESVLFEPPAFEFSKVTDVSAGSVSNVSSKKSPES
jgi:hypothetical protein